MTTQTNANDVLMGASGPPAAAFAEPGTTWEGKIVSPPQSFHSRKFTQDGSVGDLAYYPSGDPIMGVTVVIQTDDRDVAIDNDDGTRTIWLDGRYNKEAVRNAVKTSGAKGLEVGGYLKITFTHREDPMDKRSRKYWDVSYTPAGNAALMNDEKVSPAKTDGVDPAATAKQLLSSTTLTDVQVAAAAGLTVEQVAGLRAVTSPPF